MTQYNKTFFTHHMTRFGDLKKRFPRCQSQLRWIQFVFELPLQATSSHHWISAKQQSNINAMINKIEQWKHTFDACLWKNKPSVHKLSCLTSNSPPVLHRSTVAAVLLLAQPKRIMLTIWRLFQFQFPNRSVSALHEKSKRILFPYAVFRWVSLTEFINVIRFMPT